MTPDQLEALARRVETEEPSNELWREVLAALGSEAEPGSAPNPLWSIDDADRARPAGWHVWYITNEVIAPYTWLVHLILPDKGIFACGRAPTEPRARTAADIRAMAVDAREADHG